MAITLKAAQKESSLSLPQENIELCLGGVTTGG